jgi:hypothetical protein
MAVCRRVAHVVGQPGDRPDLGRGRLDGGRVDVGDDDGVPL